MTFSRLPYWLRVFAIPIWVPWAMGVNSWLIASFIWVMSMGKPDEIPAPVLWMFVFVALWVPVSSTLKIIVRIILDQPL